MAASFRRSRLHPCHCLSENPANLIPLAPTRSSIFWIGFERAAARPPHLLFKRYASWLRRWARGRLPQWARDGVDTSDLVQDALHRTFEQLPRIRSVHVTALRSYLRRTIQNRIGDQLRHATLRRYRAFANESIQLSGDAAPQYQQFLDNETWSRYLTGLEQLTPRQQRLIVGRLELGYSYRQMALVERLSTPDAARMAFRRALVRLSNVMPGE